jgi:hypothetical protein
MRVRSPLLVPASRIPRSIILIGAALLSGHALAAPWFAGPSNIVAGETATFKGGGFAASSSVEVISEEPDGGSTNSTVQVNVDGTLMVEVQPGKSGLYKITVRDTQGNPLASTNFFTR